MQFDEVRQRVRRIREDLRAEVDQIVANPNLSDTGRARAVAETVLAHRAQADKLRDQFSANNEEVRMRLTRKLFGAPTGADAATIMVYRDAEDRAAKLDSPEAAEKMLKRAQEHGDTLLVRAVAGQAHAKGWREVTETYAHSAGLGVEYDELRDLPSGRELGLAVAALFSVPLPPSAAAVLGSNPTDDHLRKLAQEPPPEPQRERVAPLMGLRP